MCLLFHIRTLPSVFIHSLITTLGSIIVGQDMEVRTLRECEHVDVNQAEKLNLAERWKPQRDQTSRTEPQREQSNMEKLQGGQNSRPEAPQGPKQQTKGTSDA